MFEVKKLVVKVGSVSTNQEKVGASKELKLGITMHFSFIGENGLLDRFEAGLLDAFYQASADGRQSDLMNHLPQRRFQSFDTIPLVYIGLGYSAVIGNELELTKPIKVKTVKVHKLKAVLLNEGKVKYEGAIYFAPAITDVGPLSNLQEKEMVLTLTAPKVSVEGGAQEDAAPGDNDAEGGEAFDEETSNENNPDELREEA